MIFNYKLNNNSSLWGLIVRTENPCVAGSIPARATFLKSPNFLMNYTFFPPTKISKIIEIYNTKCSVSCSVEFWNRSKLNNIKV